MLRVFEMLKQIPNHLSDFRGRLGSHEDQCVLGLKRTLTTRQARLVLADHRFNPTML